MPLTRKSYITLSIVTEIRQLSRQIPNRLKKKREKSMYSVAVPFEHKCVEELYLLFKKNFEIIVAEIHLSGNMGEEGSKSKIVGLADRQPIAMK